MDTAPASQNFVVFIYFVLFSIQVDKLVSSCQTESKRKKKDQIKQDELMKRSDYHMYLNKI